MKKATAILFVILVVAVLAAMAASAKGLLPSMVYRRGLTNWQIDQILAAHPDAQLRMTAQDWRAMRYQLFRYDCMTNYVELIGGSNDCARVLLELHDEAETWRTRHAAVSNLYARTERNLSVATERAQEYAAAYTSATNAYAALDAQYNQSVADFQGVLHNLVEEYNAATNSLAVAQAKVARTEAFKAWLVEQRDSARLSTTKALYQAILDRLEE